MQPNKQEVGLVLEPTDIPVANEIYTVFKEKFESGDVLDCMKFSSKELIKADDTGQSVLREQDADQVLKYARIALSDTKNKYVILNKDYSNLLELHAYETEAFKQAEAYMPVLEQRITAFGAFATAAEANLDLSRNAVAVAPGV